MNVLKQLLKSNDMKKLICKDAVRIKSQIEQIKSLIQPLQALYDEFIEHNAIFTFEAVNELIFAVQGDIYEAPRREGIEFINSEIVKRNVKDQIEDLFKNAIVNAQESIYFGSIKLNKEEFKKIIAVPDLEEITNKVIAVKSNYYLQGVGQASLDSFIVINGKVEVKDGVYDKIEEKFTYYAVGNRQIEMLQSAQNLCDALNQFTNSAHANSASIWRDGVTDLYRNGLDKIRFISSVNGKYYPCRDTITKLPVA